MPELSALKFETLEGALTQSIQIPLDNFGTEARLVPIGIWILDSKELVEKFCVWRQNSMRMFFTQFINSPEKVRKYLLNYAIGDPKRLLFAIQLATGEFVGHIGIIDFDKQNIEVDNFIIGEKSPFKDLAFRVEKYLCAWVFSVLKPQSIALKVFSFNFPAINLHVSVGFEKVSSSHLFVTENDGLTIYEECSPPKSNTKHMSHKFTLERK